MSWSECYLDRVTDLFMYGKECNKLLNWSPMGMNDHFCITSYSYCRSLHELDWDALSRNSFLVCFRCTWIGKRRICLPFEQANKNTSCSTSACFVRRYHCVPMMSPDEMPVQALKTTECAIRSWVSCMVTRRHVGIAYHMQKKTAGLVRHASEERSGLMFGFIQG